MAGVAVATGVRAATGLTPALKWPNDVMIELSTVGLRSQGSQGETSGASTVSRWRKLAGILAEASATGGELQFIILGIGLNLTPAAYPPDVQARATSLEGELGRPVDRALVLVEILSALAEGRRQLLAGDDAAILERWRALAPSSQGRRVRWSTIASEKPAASPQGITVGGGGVGGVGAGAAASGAGAHESVSTVRTGLTRGIDTDGALLVETASGIERIIAGEVEWE
jgi:biotin-(acetyl-CoA carboxylase) ligase